MNKKYRLEEICTEIMDRIAIWNTYFGINAIQERAELDKDAQSGLKRKMSISASNRKSFGLRSRHSSDDLVNSIVEEADDDEDGAAYEQQDAFDFLDQADEYNAIDENRSPPHSSRRSSLRASPRPSSSSYGQGLGIVAMAAGIGTRPASSAASSARSRTPPIPIHHLQSPIRGSTPNATGMMAASPSFNADRPIVDGIASQKISSSNLNQLD